MRKDKNDMALLRFSIIGPLVNGTYTENSVSEYAREASKKTYYHKGEEIRYSEETIKKWYYNYLKYGYDGLINIQRSDYQKPRVISEDAIREIDELLIKFPKITATTIYNKLLEKHVMETRDVSLKTIQRYVKSRRVDIPKEEIERRRFQMREPNDMWQTDTSTGPYVLIAGKKYRTYLIMFLDDCSRLITGYGFYLNDNAINMQKTLKKAVKTYGVPRVIYMDNGGPYVNRQLKIICARLGIVGKNTRAYDPQAKGKIERCFRTIKMQWMNGTNWNDFKSLEDVEKSFAEYVRKYNNEVHSVIGQKPNDKFHTYEKIRRIDNDKIDKMFWHEEQRKADATSVISIENRKYEVPRECIGKKCTYMYDPENLETVYYENISCKQLNLENNSKKKRKTGISFIGAVNNENDVIDLNEREHSNDEIS